MPDMEKVINGFKECMGEGRCTKCVYGKETPMLSCKELLWDAFVLLKEKEQKTGHWTTKRTLQHDGEWYCDQCEYEPTVFENTPFCPNCGAKMEGR